MHISSEQNNSHISIVYTVFVASLPLISVYASGIEGFSLGDLLLIFFFFVRLFDAINTKTLMINERTLVLLPLIIAIPSISMISVLRQSNVDVYPIIIRIVRRLFYYLSVVIVSGNWFVEHWCEKTMLALGKVGAVYLFLQYLAYYRFHVVLHGYLPFLKVYHEYYSQIDYQQLYATMFRPTSFLLEPAHMSRYLIISLSVALFGRVEKNRWFWAIVISIAIFASTSGIGLMSCLMVWFIWLLAGRYGKNDKRIPAYYIFIYIAIVITGIIALNNSVIQLSLYRITNSNLSDVNTAGGARFRGFMQYFNLDVFGKMFGMGYGSTPNTVLSTWFSGASYMLYGTGIIGLLVCLIMFINLYINSRSRLAKVLCVIFFFLFIVDDCFMSNISILYLSMICFSDDNIVYEVDTNEDSFLNRHMVSKNDC